MIISVLRNFPHATNWRLSCNELGISIARAEAACSAFAPDHKSSFGSVQDRKEVKSQVDREVVAPAPHRVLITFSLGTHMCSRLPAPPYLTLCVSDAVINNHRSTLETVHCSQETLHCVIIRLQAFADAALRRRRALSLSLKTPRTL